jgi:hypothetical protein
LYSNHNQTEDAVNFEILNNHHANDNQVQFGDDINVPILHENKTMTINEAFDYLREVVPR